MITLHRLNGEPVYVNLDLILWVEATPGTVITFVDGAALSVRESCADICRAIEHCKNQRQLSRSQGSTTWTQAPFSELP